MPRMQLHLGSRRVAEQILVPDAPARAVPDRVEYWGLKLIIGVVLLGSALISLIWLFLIIHWISWIIHWIGWIIHWIGL